MLQTRAAPKGLLLPGGLPAPGFVLQLLGLDTALQAAGRGPFRCQQVLCGLFVVFKLQHLSICTEKPLN